MGLSNSSQSRFSRSQSPTIQMGRVTAPLGGVNTVDSIAQMPENDCIYAYNISPFEKGLKVRKGYVEHATDLEAPVRTLVPFYSDDPIDNVLFAVTNEGIYDVTVSGAVGTIALSFGDTTDPAGWGVWAHHINAAGVRTLFYADEANGLYEYTTAGGWTATTGITGITEADVRFIMVHKLRIWLITNTGDAYYLPVGAKAGAATLFILAAQVRRGGELVAIYNWTIDGGEGLDDYFIAVTRGGDAVIYKGDDPSAAATWAKVGIWYVGQTPNGRRIAAPMGGSLHLLSQYGLVDIAQLISNRLSIEDVSDPTSSRKITPSIRREMASHSSLFGWDIVPILSEGAVLVLRPIVLGEQPLQFVQHTGLGGWSFWRGPPMHCAIEFNGRVYFGSPGDSVDSTSTDLGTVYVMTGGTDGASLDGTGGDPVDFSFLTAFSDLGAAGVQKQPMLFHAHWMTETGLRPVYEIKARYEYDFNEITTVPTEPITGGSLWDLALWDSSVWGGSPDVYSKLLGSTGLGFSVAIAIRGSSNDQAAFLDCIVGWVVGGPL